MQFDYSKLRGRITEICGCQMVFAEKMVCQNVHYR